MRRSRLFLILFASVFILLNISPVIRGCSPPPDYFEGYMTFMASNLAHDPLFEKYYYDMSNHRSPYMIDESIHQSQTDANLAEWQKYLGGGIPLDQLSELIYQMPVEKLAQIRQNGLKNKTMATGNKALDSIAKPDRMPALDYLIYAKQCEPYVIVTSWWDVENEMQERRKPAEMQHMIELGLARVPLVKDSFLKLRYGYQIVRMAHFAGKPQDSLKYYQQLIDPVKVNSVIAGWCLRLKIGALRKTGKVAESLVQSSLMFDQNPAMMDEAYNDFADPVPNPTDHLWSDCLRIAGNPHRQATLWMLSGLQEERIRLEPLAKMVELEPGSPRVEVMLMRLLNKIEREHLSSALFFASSDPEMQKKKEIALKYVGELEGFVAGVDKMKVHQPALWYATAAYLKILEGEHEQAREQISKAIALKTKNIDLEHQIQLLQNLNEITAAPRMTDLLENSTCDTLKWLDTVDGVKSNLENIRESFYTLLARKYFSAGDLPKAYCCLSKAGIGVETLLENSAASDLDRMIAYLNKPGKTAFETIICANPKYDADDIYSIKGTMFLKRRNYREALANFEKISANHWAKVRKDWSDEGEYGKLRTSFEKACYNARTGLYQYPAKGFTHYTKVDFARKVVQLLDEAEHHPEKADRCYFQIANGFFHTPFWAYNENLGWSKYWEEMGYDESADFFGMILPKADPTIEDVSGKRIIAQSYYVKAMNATKDPELAAQCCFMAQACQTQFSYYDAFEEQGKAHDCYFALLYQKYRQTAFYKSVLRECDTLKDYVANL